MSLLRIDERQYDALKALDFARFRATIMAHLRKKFPDQAASADDLALARHVEWGIGRARSYEITLETDVARFIELVSGFGEDFDRKPSTAWMGDILRRTGISPRARLDMLLERLAFGTG